eukprot:SAG25_NODE_7943_length_449_cov_0.717143_1_plen_132_part_01
MKIKTWHNTTGEVSDILFEDIILDNAAEAVSISGNYGGTACPCKWQTNYGGPGQRTECRSYGPSLSGAAHWPVGYVGVGGICGPEGGSAACMHSLQFLNTMPETWPWQPLQSGMEPMLAPWPSVKCTFSTRT